MKKVITLFLSLIVCMSISVTVVFAAEVQNTGRDVCDEQVLAETLKQLGLFKGVSNTNLDLGRAPTRVEALVMLIRVLGEEQTALGGTWRHPFTDVPDWADDYVGYAYVNGLTNGVAPTLFGDEDAGAATYLTFMLRALGYSDKNGADFTWDNPYDLARTTGILPDMVDTENFWRADVATISYAALNATLKGSDITLAEKLIDSGALDLDYYYYYYEPDEILYMPPEDYVPKTQVLSAVEIAEKCSPAVFYVETYSVSGQPLGLGSGFFISSDGFAITNNHVIQNAEHVRVYTTDGYVYDNVKILDMTEEKDLALLKIESSDEFPYLEFGNSNTLKQGETVYAIGSPQGFDNTMSQGIVSNPRRYLEKKYIQISVPIDHGSSGGALINQYGEVVGVTTGGYEDTIADLNLAMPINYVRALDMSSETGYFTWEEVFYPGFYQVPDFGYFAGVELLAITEIENGYILTYNPESFIDMYTSDGYLIYTAEEALQAAINYYIFALEFYDLEISGQDDDSYSYASFKESVMVIPCHPDDGTIRITIRCENPYYEHAPEILDAGWFFELPLEERRLRDHRQTYIYKWVDDYDLEAFGLNMVAYLLLLEEDGFKLIESGEVENSRDYRFYLESELYTMELLIGESLFTVIIKPI